MTTLTPSQLVDQINAAIEDMPLRSQKRKWFTWFSDQLEASLVAEGERCGMGEMAQVWRLAKNRKPLAANQGQALDGFSELVGYRSIIEKYNPELIPDGECGSLNHTFPNQEEGWRYCQCKATIEQFPT